MGDHKRLGLLILIMIGLCLIVGVTAIGVIYDAALGRERARLMNIAQSQARLMEAFARLEAPAAPSGGGQAKKSAVSQILEAHRRLREPVIGQTAELQLGRRDGDFIVFVTPARGAQQPHDPVAFGGVAAEPMSAALSGQSGTMIGRDYAGRRVLAAFEPVPDLGLGLVAKIDMSEINEQYLRAAALAGLASLAAVAGAVLLFFRVGEPMIRRLTESEIRYRELFDNMDIGVAVYHAGSRAGEFVFEDFNRAGERIAQIDRRQLIGRSLTETFPGAGEFGLVDVLTRVWRTGKTERLPTGFYRDGRIEGWRDASVYRLPSGEIVTLFSDVSERERQAEALRASEERYRTLVERQPDPMCRFLPDTTLTFVNKAYADFYGREPEELIGKRWIDLAPKEERPRFFDELASFSPENPERHEETRSTRVDGKVCWHLCHIYGLFDRSGRVVSFQTFGTDITSRKQAEQAVRESERRARAQLEELETIYRTAPIGLALYDRDLNFARLNSALADMNGLSVEEHLGRYVWDVVPHLREAVDPHFRKVLETGEPDAFEVSGETPKAPGVQRDWIAHYYPLKGSDGSVVGVGAIIQEITERKHGERALNEAVAQYKAMGESVPYGVWLCGPDGGARYVSQSFLDLLGMSMEEVRPFGWTKRLPPEDVEPMLQRWRHCVLTGEPWESEHRIIAPDGEMRHVLARGRPVRDRNGTITSWAGINLDITERKRAEQALRESEARYRAAGEAIRYGVWVCNPEGGVEFVSEIFLDLVGKTLDKVRPRGWLDRLPPEDLKPTLEAWRECVRTGGEWKWEHKVRDQDGGYHTILSLGRPVRDESGQISSWVGFNLDISERKRAEEALAQHVGLLTAITDSAADAIFVSDDHGRVTLINPAAEKIFGWSRHELTGRLLHEALHHHHLDGHPYPASECPLNRVYRTGETLLRHEDVFFRKDGSQVQVACSNAPLMIEGRIAGSVLVAHDITERKRSERALRESEARLRRTVEYAPFPIIVHAEDGEVVHVSEAWLTLTGYSREQIASIAAWTELAYRERKDMLRAEIDKLGAIRLGC